MRKVYAEGVLDMSFTWGLVRFNYRNAQNKCDIWLWCPLFMPQTVQRFYFSKVGAQFFLINSVVRSRNKWYSKWVPCKTVWKVNNQLFIFPKEMFESSSSIWSDRCKLRSDSGQFGFIFATLVDSDFFIIYENECRVVPKFLRYNSFPHTKPHLYWKMGCDCRAAWLSMTLMWLP